MNYNFNQYYDPMEAALQLPDDLFNKYREIKKRNLPKKKYEASSKVLWFPIEGVNHVLNNLGKFETRIQFWMMVDDIISFYPRLFRKIKNLF